MLTIALVSLVVGCPQPEKKTTAVDDNTGNANAPAAATLAVVFSATETDPWAREIIDVLGAKLGITPWDNPSTEGHLDALGPYDGTFRGATIDVSICFVGFSAVSDLAGQLALADEAMQWLSWVEPDVVWLDGDPVQMQVGRQLDPELPIVFSGVVLDRTLYYDLDRLATGVYRRHNLSAVIGEIWRNDAEATTYSLITDDSPNSLVRASQFALLNDALPEGHEFLGPPPCNSWDELAATVRGVPDAVDALIFCGIGEPECAEVFLDDPCPANLLDGSDLPAIVLGPSRMDSSGATSMQIKPSAHAATALDMISSILGGKAAYSMPVVTPEDMSLFVSER